MAALDFNALRAQTMVSGADEEAVTVNTRALIDKVLARYSGEWTVLRELIQNAADASATKITVRFETIPSPTVPLPQNATSSSLLKHTMQHHTLKRLVVTNNGQTFNENDWSRLKRIAEGNPDETKIGAFGVGFYSTFADCEEPFVSSGDQAMAFFWKNNSLFTRRLKLSGKDSTSDTNFVLDYRDTTSTVPNLLSMSQFLANSLTFVGIENIDLYVDDWNILSLRKTTSPSEDVMIPKDIEPKTTEGFMKVTKVSKELAQINGEWMPIVGYKQQIVSAKSSDKDAAPSLRKFFSRLAGATQTEEPNTAKLAEAEAIDLTVRVKATVFLNVDTATIKTFTGQKFNEELERATKKPPPKMTKLAVLSAPYIANDSVDTTKAAGDIFATVLPTRSGRIFIGFPTHQTTGLSAHISAPSVIPTVERESIDLNAKYVRTWNMEMLRAAGIVCRIAWHAEMMNLKSKITRMAEGRRKIRMDDVKPFLPEAIATFKNFTFKESTPSPRTGELLEEGFWRSGKKPSIEVLSSCGVLPTHEVRKAPKDLSFVEGVPVLPEELVQEAKSFVDKLIDFGLVTEVTVSDIKLALESTPLSSKQVTEFLSWLTKQASKKQLDNTTITNLLSVAVANDETEGGEGMLLLLGDIEYFQSPSRIPINMPVPRTVMPFRFTGTFSKNDLEALNWQELQIVPWVRWLLAEANNRDILTEEQDLTKSSAFSAQVFPLLSKQWDTMSQSSKQTLIELMAIHTVMPTKMGMKRPGDAYFPNVKLFDDLPTVTGIGSVKDKVLTAFGVRKTVELGVVFDRLLKSSPKQGEISSASAGSHVALIQYLASVRDDIPKADITRLKNTPICPKEDRDSANRESQARFKVSDLFEPRPQLRDLGLPVLAWPGPYRNSNAEGRFLSMLGLRTSPLAAELIAILAKAGQTNNIELRDKALTYFVSNYHANGYGEYDYSAIQIPFLPLENKSELTVPSKCFVDESAAFLGFDILSRALQPHAPMFGVRRNPPIEACIHVLASRKLTSKDEARTMFTYFAGRLGEINTSVIPKLQELVFIPIFSKNKEKMFVKSYASPRNVFLGDSDTFGEIFNYVDFGQEANAFLLKCGSKPEPTKVEVAQILVREPARISQTFRNPEKYLTLLRSLADSINLLKKNKDLFREMRRAPFLLGSKHIPAAQPSKKAIMDMDEDELEADEDSQGIMEWQLCSAEEAIIVDDFVNYNLFKADILAAPQEETLEDFYYSLGSPMLGSLVEEAAKHGPRAQNQKPAERLQKQINERAALFLHDQPPDSIKHDTKWLEKNLSVQLVSSLTLRRSLKGRNLTHSEKRTAVITQVNREYTLWVVGEKPDLYQVSQALVHVLLVRPKLHSSLTLEMLLKTDLLDLRARGFNVSRILRQKAAEARLAESKRQKQLEEEQERIEEQQKAWAAVQEASKKQKTQQPSMVGAFPNSDDSPDAKGSRAAPSESVDDGMAYDEPDHFRSAQKMLSNFTKNFGFGGNKRGSQALNNVPEPIPQPTQQVTQAGQAGSGDPPPPYSQGRGEVNTGISPPHHLQSNLLSAIHKSRAHNSSQVFSRGEVNTVSETATYCDERTAHDLGFVAQIKYGIQMFLPNDPNAPANYGSQFLQQNVNGLRKFADIIKAVGETVFSLDPKILNIFYETSGKTIAFNQNGSIFCNYLYFKQLHERFLLGDDVAALAAGTDDAMVYWWVILCHELAHNLVADHSSNHSYYTEGFVAQYFGKVVGLCAKEREKIQNAPRQIDLPERQKQLMGT